MTETQKPAPVFDAEGWCHDMSLAPKTSIIDIWVRGERYPECQWEKPWDGTERAWCYFHTGDWCEAYRPTAWRLPPAPPVKEGV